MLFQNVKLHFFLCKHHLCPSANGCRHNSDNNVEEVPATACACHYGKNPTKPRTEILREITSLQAIYWISATWKEVDSGITSECVSVSDDIEDDKPIAVLHLALELFDCHFREFVAIDCEFATCDNNMTEWDKNAVDILKEMTTEKEKKNTSDSEDQSEKPNPDVVSINVVAECLSKMR
jgi:hypothetical protein